MVVTLYCKCDRFCRNQSFLIEQHTFKSVNNCLNTNIYYYLETPSVQSSNIYSNVVHSFNAGVNYTFVTA
jgi:hypothetical protein